MNTEIKTFVRHMPHFNEEGSTIRGGWGNGYAGVPKGHSLYGVTYTELFEMGVYFSGSEITWSYNIPTADHWADCPDHDYWWFGFDTLHHGDTLENWPKERVEEVTQQLADFLNGVKIEEYTVVVEVKVRAVSAECAESAALDCDNWITSDIVEVK